MRGFVALFPSPDCLFIVAFADVHEARVGGCDSQNFSVSTVTFTGGLCPGFPLIVKYISTFQPSNLISGPYKNREIKS